MSPLKAPANLPELVKAAFARAKTNGDLTYYATQVTILSLDSVPVRFKTPLSLMPCGTSPPITPRC